MLWEVLIEGDNNKRHILRLNYVWQMSAQSQSKVSEWMNGWGKCVKNFFSQRDSYMERNDICVSSRTEDLLVCLVTDISVILSSSGTIIYHNTFTFWIYFRMSWEVSIIYSFSMLFYKVEFNFWCFPFSLIQIQTLLCRKKSSRKKSPL